MKVLSRNNRGEQTELGHMGQVRRVCDGRDGLVVNP